MHGARDAARVSGFPDDTLVEDLGRIAIETIAHDALGAASATHAMANWAKDSD